MRRRRGEPGFTPISWDEALDAVADGIRTAGGDRTAIYLTSRGITNEVYYAAAKAARAMGVASIDSAARTCHAPSTVGLKQTIGVAASTCSMQDVLESDLIVLWGTNVANNQPVFTKYLYLARKRGRPGGRREPVPGARPGALLGAVERRVGAVRHQAVRPPRAGPPGGRRRLRQRRAPTPHRARRRRPRRGSPSTPRAGTSWPPTSPRLDRADAARAGRCRRRHVGALRRPVRRGVGGRPRLEHGHHPAHPRRRRRAGDRQRRPRPRQRRAATAPG